MRGGKGILILVGSVIAVPAMAQSGPAPGTTSPDTTLWQADTLTSSLYSARQTPNGQPSAPSQPVSAQAQNALPSWYPQAPGMPFAGGTLYRGVTAGAFFDDNVFATNSNRQSDWAFFARPELGWVAHGPNYTVTAEGFVEGRSYTRFSSEDQVNGSVGAGFTTMPDNNTQIVGKVRYIHEHLDRGSSETVATNSSGQSTLLSTLFTQPVTYDEGIESIALNKRYGNWWSSVGAAGLEVNYQNATIGGGGAVPAGETVDFSYSNGVIANVNGRIGYVVRPLTSIFVEVAANTRNWQVSYFDSTGYRIVGGVLFEQGPGARVKGEFWGGYMDQVYNGATLQNISTWTYGLGLAALVTEKLTAVFEGRREAKEAALGLAVLSPGVLGADAATCTAVGGAVCVSTIESEVGARLDYALMPKVVVGGGVTFLEDEYQGPLAFGRVDRTAGPLASIKYLATPNITLGFDYRNVAFSSDGGAAPPPSVGVTALPYSRNVYLFSMNGKW